MIRRCIASIATIFIPGSARGSRAGFGGPAETFEVRRRLR